METVSTILSDLGNQLNDPSEQVFTSSLKLTALNNAQNELVLRILAYSEKYQGVYDLLSDIVERENIPVGTSGFALSGLSSRNFMRNGYVNSRVTLNGVYKYPTRLTVDRLGLTQNSFMAGSDEDPIVYIDNDKLYIDVDVGSYPITVTLWYVGKPYTLAVSASGSGKTQSVATPDLNVMMHDLLAKIAERDLRRGRGDESDFAEAAQIEQQVNLEIQALVRGEMMSPKSGTVGQFNRKEEVPVGN